MGWNQGGNIRKRFSESEIINLLRAIKVKISGSMGMEEACRSLGVSDKSDNRWRKLYGSLERTKVKRCRDLEKENGRLRKIVVDLELDKSILVVGTRSKRWRITAILWRGTLKNEVLKKSVIGLVHMGLTGFRC